MSEQKKKKYNEKEFLSVIPDAMPAQDDQQSIPLRETVFLTLRKLILTGKLDPGERLTEVRLGKILGTSRTPIREAIRKLEIEGLVTITPGSGARVARITEGDLQDVMEVRSTLDQLCASLASQRITEEDKICYASRIKFPISNIVNESTAIFSCTVLKNGKLVGEAEITLQNQGHPQISNYRLVLENGDQVFQYDEYGNAPNASKLKTPLEILPVIPRLLTPSGIEVSSKNYTVK